MLELCRWLYNDALAYRKNAWEKEERSSRFETQDRLPQLKLILPELKEVHSLVLQNVAWVMLVTKTESKAAYSGSKVVLVDPRQTSRFNLFVKSIDVLHFREGSIHICPSIFTRASCASLLTLLSLSLRAIFRGPTALMSPMSPSDAAARALT